MEITAVRVYRLSNGGKLKALASVTFDDAFVVHQIRIVEGSSGLFVAMPVRRTPGGTYRDLAHPVSASFRERLQEAVLAAYGAQPELGVRGGGGSRAEAGS